MFANKEMRAWDALTEQEQVELGTADAVQVLDRDGEWVDRKPLRFEVNGVYRTKPKEYDWRTNPDKVVYKDLSLTDKKALDAVSLGDLEYWCNCKCWSPNTKDHRPE